MATVDIQYASSNLPRLVEAAERSLEMEIIITCNGRPAARLVAITHRIPGQRIGVAKGEFIAPEDIDHDNIAIVDLFEGRNR